MKLQRSQILFGGGLVIASIIGLFVLVVVSAGNKTTPESAGQVITLTVDDMRFDLDTITVKVGQPVTIQLVNNDEMDHAFAIEALDVYSDQIGPRKTTSITFTPDTVGSYTFICPFPGHAQLGMTGTFEVVA